MKQWNTIFKKEGKVFLKPQEDMPRIVKFFKKRGVKKVLDLGCGSIISLIKIRWRKNSKISKFVISVLIPASAIIVFWQN